jgi:hypothetical protein
VFGFFGIDIPIVAIAVLEVLFLAALFAVYHLQPEVPPSRN